MVLIIQNGGDREINYFKKGEDFPLQAVRLSNADARKVGAILSGAYVQPTMV